jgi:hypothetical protein
VGKLAHRVEFGRVPKFLANHLYYWEAAVTRNADELIHLYNEIDTWLKARSGMERDDEFSARLVRVGSRNAVVRPHVSFLSDVARLRNAIVHDRRYPPEIVADPRDELIAQLRQVRDAILKPPLLRNFGSNPLPMAADRPLREALAEMRQNDFSQIIVDGRLQRAPQKGRE